MLQHKSLLNRYRETKGICRPLRGGGILPPLVLTAWQSA